MQIRQKWQGVQKNLAVKDAVLLYVAISPQ